MPIATFEADTHVEGPGRPKSGVVIVIVAIVVIGGLAAVLWGTMGSSPKGAAPTTRHGRGTSVHAKRLLLSELSATLASGNFDVTFHLTATPPAGIATTRRTPCMSSATLAGPTGIRTEVARSTVRTGAKCVTGKASYGLDLSGHGVIDTDPYAILVVTTVPTLGLITLRGDATQVFEEGGGNYGLSSPTQGSGSGSQLSGFASLVEGTLGPEEGPMAMLGLSGPTGYLQLTEKNITGVAPSGSGTIGGTAVNIYTVTEKALLNATTPTFSPQQQTAIRAADAALTKDGLGTLTTTVSVDALGFIQRTSSALSFANGSVMTTQATFSNFGCAGTVLMPGQTGSSTPPVGCVSPDQKGSSTSASTTSVSTTSESTTSVRGTGAPVTTIIRPTGSTGPPATGS